ncbi:MAG: cyclic-di-AMP receptor [Desulfotomaculales bacterium]|jgi:uncharacterized protein YaaQ
MKLVVAIVNSEEEAELLDKLNNRGYRVTRLASTGGFLRRGNTTLIMGVQDDQVPPLLDLLKSYSQQKKVAAIAGNDHRGFFEMSGVTVFILSVEKFIQW